MVHEPLADATCSPAPRGPAPCLLCCQERLAGPEVRGAPWPCSELSHIAAGPPLTPGPPLGPGGLVPKACRETGIRSCLGGARAAVEATLSAAAAARQPEAQGHQPLIILLSFCQPRQHPVGTVQIHLTFKGPGWRPQGGSAKSLHPRGWASPSSSAPDCPCHRRAESLKRGGTARRQPSLIH